jgi:hypothetical protein
MLLFCFRSVALTAVNVKNCLFQHEVIFRNISRSISKAPKFKEHSHGLQYGFE